MGSRPTANWATASRILHATEVEIKAEERWITRTNFWPAWILVLAPHTSLRQPARAGHSPADKRHPQPARGYHRARPPGGISSRSRKAPIWIWSSVLAAAAESGVALEINAHPARLDLDDVMARRAHELGIPISINTDAHAEPISTCCTSAWHCRRAWLEPKDVINAWPVEKLLKWLKQRHQGDQ